MSLIDNFGAPNIEGETKATSLLFLVPFLILSFFELLRFENIEHFLSQLKKLYQLVRNFSNKNSSTLKFKRNIFLSLHDIVSFYY